MITKLFVSSKMFSLKAGSESIVMNIYTISSRVRLVNVIYTVTIKKSSKAF